MSGWIVETLVATTALMVLVLLVRDRVAALFGARIAYLLWLLPALRMVLPPLPESFGPAPIDQIPSIVDLPMIDLSVFRPVAEAAAPVAPSIDWPMLLLGIWLGGALLMMAWHLIAYHRFVRAALRESIDLPEMDANGIEVCASRLVEGPFAAGVLLPTIVLPHDYRTRYSAEELRLAMTHEAVHHRRGDLSINMVALVMLSLHWFNPIAWRAWRAFRADQELACDAVVLHGASNDERFSYAAALVKSACARTPVAACSLNPRDQLKTRLRMMRNAQERGVSGRMLAVVLVSGGLALTASGGIAAETTAEIREKVQARVIQPVVAAVATKVEAVAEATEIASVATSYAALRPIPPVPPVAPAPPAAPSAPDAPEAWAAPEAPQAPIAPVAPTIPMPPRAPTIAMSFDHDGMAMRIEASAEAAEAARIATSAGHRSSACKGGNGGTVWMSEGKHGEPRRIAYCGKVSELEVRKLQIDSMNRARKSLIESRKIEREQLAQALAGLDAEIARLKATLSRLD
jgi:bla regulator protein BlaR1